MNPRYRYPDRASGPTPVASGSGHQQPRVYVSGEWEIDLIRRELRARGIAVPIGSRAFEIVEALVQSPGKLVTKDDLMARVWSGAIVEGNTLQVHISAIRKALGADRNMLATVSGRGYRLLGSWTVRQESGAAEPDAPGRARVAEPSCLTNVPVAASALIGRESAVLHLRDLLSAYRVVTLTGPGGIGKTVLAAEVARRQFPTLEGDVLLVELVSLSDPSLVPAAVASVLGLKLSGGEISAESVARAIGGKRLLLVLDNCEHVADEAANFAETVVRQCARASILATSREVLRIEGEQVYHVPALDVPPLQNEESSDVLEHSAVQLFVARTRSVRADFSAQTENLPAIAAICRRLDGIPLAIEFAAARAATLGVRQVAARLDDRFALLAGGRRTALPRHQTLRATLDWSHDLLPESERRLLRRLAIFPAGFTLDAAAYVMSDLVSGIAVGISNLISKSLVTLDGSAPAGRWRLLETTRAYALERLAESGEGEQAARYHAEFFRDLFAPAGPGSQPRLAIESMAREIDNVRAALDWSFSPAGDSAIGVALASVMAPAFFAMSLLPECHRWSERAILALDDAARGGAVEMQLQGALGMSIMFTRGSSEAARLALTRGLAVAEERGDAENQLRLLSRLHMFYTRIGDFNTALQYARRAAAVVGVIEDPAAIALAHTVLGMALRHAGDLSGTRAELEAALRHGPISQWVNTFYLGYDQYNLASITLAICLQYQGYPDQAQKRVYQTVKDAASIDHPVTLAIVLSWAARVLLWVGDLANAEEHTDWLLSHAKSYSLGPYLIVARGLKGEVAIRRGDATAGIDLVQDCLTQLHAARYDMSTTEFSISLAEGFRAIGRVGEADRLIDDAIALADANGAFSLMPELLRVKGSVLVSMDPPKFDEAERCFMRSMDWSRRQTARAWELRTAVDLATLWVRQRRPDAARAVLQPVFEQFDEGLDVADLRMAKQLLSSLS
jgi:non-specific serine/threonine protein kinase